eukprot:FR735576.1.p3 GENE.FR735576.1~~FR735576.1.p3  ORF type:complete len:101 (+),score=15.99 FR735576.1:154-456(+)
MKRTRSESSQSTADRRELVQELLKLETQIKEIELQYLDESTIYGDVLSGFNGFEFASGCAGRDAPEREAIEDRECLFSLSSLETHVQAQSNSKAAKRKMY